MRRKSAVFPIHKIFLLILLSGALLLKPGGGFNPTVQAQQDIAVPTWDVFTINPGVYQIPESLLIALKSNLSEISEMSGGATAFGVGYYEEHSHWAWIDLMVANGDYFDEEKMGPSFLYLGVRNDNTWNVVFAENDQEYLSVLDSISKDRLNAVDIELLDEYHELNRTSQSAGALVGELLFPWPGSQNSWRFSPYGFHVAGFESLGMEQNAEAIDLLPPGSAQPARALAMQGGTVMKKLECTWNTVLIIRHDGYPDPKRFLYLHIQNGTSPVGVGTVISKGQYLGDLRTPVFNGYWSDGTCSAQGSGDFTCERDLNPSTQNLCSSSTGRHLHLGFGTDRSIVIDGNVIADLVLGQNYLSTNLERNDFPIEQSFGDVPISHPYYEDIEILYANGLTAGCTTSPLKFCPDDVMNRAQSAVFMLRGNYGSGYNPLDDPDHLFADDWTPGSWAEKWAEAMYTSNLSAGCKANPRMFCPWEQMPREQAVVFALRLKYGKDYNPPAATGTVFADLTDTGYFATKWAEQAYTDGLIPACGTSGGKPKFCPKELVSRGLGAYMIVRAKNLTIP